MILICADVKFKKKRFPLPSMSFIEQRVRMQSEVSHLRQLNLFNEHVIIWDALAFTDAMLYIQNVRIYLHILDMLLRLA